jgi:hypothetical protein
VVQSEKVRRGGIARAGEPAGYEGAKATCGLHPRHPHGAQATLHPQCGGSHWGREITRSEKSPCISRRRLLLRVVREMRIVRAPTMCARRFAKVQRWTHAAVR